VFVLEREEREEIDRAMRNEESIYYGESVFFFYKHKHTLQLMKKSGDIENSLSICSE
jgi:hypothetical protein